MSASRNLQAPRHCTACGEEGHRSDSPNCPAHGSSPLKLRELSTKEKVLAFSGVSSEYLDAVREMEGGVAYAIAVNGTPLAKLRRNLCLAAEFLELKLKFAPYSGVSREVVVELDDGS